MLHKSTNILIMKTYKYLYYKLCCIYQGKKDEQGNAHINAVILISFLILSNIVTIPLTLMAIFGKDIIATPTLPQNWIIFLFAIAYGISQYFFLAHKKKYVKIVSEFKDENEEQRKSGLLYTWIYIVASFGIPIYILLFTIPK